MVLAHLSPPVGGGTMGVRVTVLRLSALFSCINELFQDGRLFQRAQDVESSVELVFCTLLPEA